MTDSLSVLRMTQRAIIAMKRGGGGQSTDNFLLQDLVWKYYPGPAGVRSNKRVVMFPAKIMVAGAIAIDK